jgi:hypothetical protein
VTTAGVPVAGAKAVLLRSATRRGRFRPVPNGSRFMSISNRRNPDRTTQLGVFHWDVYPAFYRVSAQAAGCHAPRAKLATVLTKILPVPPPALNLRLVLACPHLRRAATSTAVRLKKAIRGELILTVSVRSSGHSRTRPAGNVTITAGRRRLAVAALVAGSTTQLTVLTAHPPKRIAAAYSGDGLFKPSASKAVRG